ncbi:hypothetical protein OAC89_03310 [Deltaproteobacteria bacterium]|nr:hypothetical protein [Deltaproteobacteria bacterium]
MSCYFRHMKDIFEEAGVEVTGDNKKEIDRIIHGLVEEEYKNCPSAWKAVKEHIRGDEKAREQFIKKLKTEIKGV